MLNPAQHGALPATCVPRGDSQLTLCNKPCSLLYGSSFLYGLGKGNKSQCLFVP